MKRSARESTECMNIGNHIAMTGNRYEVVDRLLESFRLRTCELFFSEVGRSSYEKLTNLGSLGSPSGAIPFFANRPSVYILLASSKFTRLFFIIFWISRFEASSKPARLSPAETFPDKSKAEEVKPFSMSDANEDGSREYRYEEPGKFISGKRGTQ